MASDAEVVERLNTALADRYRIERVIGEGGMATVYLAIDIRHDRKVALKVLRADLAASLGAERFLQEVRVTANLQHPHILPLFDSGEADGFLFYVMPFIEGESLRERLVREHELPVPEAARLLRDVVDALAAAHKLGVVHRDIKPENVLISGRHAMVADFGVAKAVSEATGRQRLTTMGVALGTPSYMAPEQAVADEAIDHRADIYAVGAMAYELLTGRPPFTGGTAQQILAAQVMETPQPVTELRASVPPALETLIMRCLEKKPADRWQSAEEMLPHLEAAATPSGGITPTDMLPVTRPSTPLRRRRLAWLAGTGVVLLVVAGVALTFLTGGRVGPAASEESLSVTIDDGKPSIAVLPFQNRSGVEDDVYFTDGLHDQLITQLTKIRGLSVRGLTSVLVYRNSPKNLRDIGEELNARYIMEGGVQRAGETVRINVQLIEAATDEHIWASVYDRTMSVENLFSIQTEIVEAVTDSLRAVITPEEMARVGATPTKNATAYDEYLVGRSWLRQRTSEGFWTALQHFEKAVEADSAFALAYVGLADTYALLYSYRYLPSQEAFSSAMELAQRALEIDHTLGEAYASLGYIQYRFDWDYDSSFPNLQRAIDLNPNDAQAYLWYGYGLGLLGRVEEALPLVERALALDPMNFNIRRQLGFIYAGARAYDRAVEQIEQALAINPGYPPAQADLGEILILMGNHEAGLRHLEELNEPRNEDGGYPLLLAWAYATVGRDSEAREMLEETLANPTQRAVDPVSVAGVFAALGEADSAFEWLERGYKIRSPDIAGVGTSAAFDPLRADPRFQDLLKRMGVPQYQEGR